MGEASKHTRNSQTSGSEGPPSKMIKFRNYTPKDDELKVKKLEKIAPSDTSDHVQEHLEKAKPEAIADEVDLTTLAPRKPDWDLKRDVAKKLDKLEKRTQKAIVELIRERLENEKADDLVSAVNAFTEV